MRGPIRRYLVWAIAGSLALVFEGCAPSVEPEPSPTPVMVSRPSTAVPTSGVTPSLVPTEDGREEDTTVTFTIVYDNNAYDEDLRTSWGFSCLVETAAGTVLFDTGGDASTLLSNMRELDIDPQAIDVVALSHIHGDHTGGLIGLLDTGANPTVYVPAGFPASFKDSVRARADLVEVNGSVEVIPGVYSTGQVGSRIVEQALAVETEQGVVVVTGCAHPGIVQMVRRAKESTEGEIALVFGGFHLGGASRGRVEGIIEDFRRLGVQRVAPCHCTGDSARELFASDFGADFLSSGVGWRVVVDGSGVRVP